MSEGLAVYLNKLTMVVRKGKQECAMEFAATIASGTFMALLAKPEQLAALPAEVAQACKGTLADPAIMQMNLQNSVAPSLAIWHGTSKVLEWEESLLMESIRVKKEEDRDQTARARIFFKVTLDEKTEWPVRNLVGRWLNLSGMRSKDAGVAGPAVETENAATA